MARRTKIKAWSYVPLEKITELDLCDFDMRRLCERQGECCLTIVEPESNRADLFLKCRELTIVVKESQAMELQLQEAVVRVTLEQAQEMKSQGKEIFCMAPMFVVNLCNDWLTMADKVHQLEESNEICLRDLGRFAADDRRIIMSLRKHLSRIPCFGELCDARVACKNILQVLASIPTPAIALSQEDIGVKKTCKCPSCTALRDLKDMHKGVYFDLKDD